MTTDEMIASAPVRETLRRKTWEAPRIEAASIDSLTMKEACTSEGGGFITKSGS